MAEIQILKENETSPVGEVFGKIQAIPQSRIVATPADDVDGTPNEPITMTLLANKVSKGNWKDITVLSGLAIIYP